MLELVKRLLLQIKCAYCFKPLSQDEERRFGKVSLCGDCFYHITGACAQVDTKGLSKAVSKWKAGGVSERKSKDFQNRTFSKKNRGFSKRKPLLLLGNSLKVFLKGFRGD